MRSSATSITVVLIGLVVTSLLTQPDSAHATIVSFDLSSKVDLPSGPVEFLKLHVNLDCSMTDLPPRVDRNEGHTLEVTARLSSGSSLSTGPMNVNIDPIVQTFGTEYHLEDSAQLGLPILEAVLAAAGISLPAAGLVELARQMLAYTDIVLYLDLSSQLGISGPAKIDQEELKFGTLQTQMFSLLVEPTAEHLQTVTVETRFLLRSRFKFDLDREKVPDWIYHALNYSMRLPWEVELASDYGDKVLRSSTTVFDKTPPTLTVIQPEQQAQFFSSNIVVRWSGSDDYGITRYEIRADEGSWMNAGMQTTYTLLNLSPGRHTIEVKAIDVAGNERIDRRVFVVRSQPGPLPGLSDALVRIPWLADAVLYFDDWIPGYGAILFLIAIGGLLAVIVLAIVLLVKRYVMV